MLVGVAASVNEHVSIASEGRFLAAVWAASGPAGSDIYAATSADGGESFSAPVRVNAIAGQANVNGEQPPQVVIARVNGRRSLVALWTAKGASGTGLLTARSSDEGRTFTPAAAVQGTNGSGNRGWESLAADSQGRPVSIWLDHREMLPSARSGEGHHHGQSAGSEAAADGAARAQASQLFFAPLDGSSPRAITRGVCYCCRTALSVAADGSIYAAWRHVYAGNQRDIAFTASRDGGRTFTAPVRVSRDDWEINGCPENGPAIAIDRQHRVHVVWPTRVIDRGAETLALFHAVTTDGKVFTPRHRIPTMGLAYHPRVATAPDGSLLVAWDEAAGGGRRVRLARGTADETGTMTFRPVDLPGPVEGRYPSLAITPTHLVVAWTSARPQPSQIAVVRVPLS